MREDPNLRRHRAKRQREEAAWQVVKRARVAARYEEALRMKVRGELSEYHIALYDAGDPGREFAVFRAEDIYALEVGAPNRAYVERGEARPLASRVTKRRPRRGWRGTADVSHAGQQPRGAAARSAPRLSSPPDAHEPGTGANVARSGISAPPNRALSRRIGARPGRVSPA
jgi:hypothetical protein